MLDPLDPPQILTFCTFLPLSFGLIHFEFKGLLDGKFQFYSNSNSTYCKQTVKNLTRCSFVVTWTCLVDNSSCYKNSATYYTFKLRPYFLTMYTCQGYQLQLISCKTSIFRCTLQSGIEMTDCWRLCMYSSFCSLKNEL